MTLEDDVVRDIVNAVHNDIEREGLIPEWLRTTATEHPRTPSETHVRWLRRVAEIHLLLGRPGPQYRDAGYIYAPYVPIHVSYQFTPWYRGIWMWGWWRERIHKAWTRIRYGKNPLLSRYAKRINPDYYRSVRP